jgi:hypothetical protein
MTADIMIMASRDDVCESENKMYWKIAKSRFSKNGGGFFMNVEYGNMRLVPPEDNGANYQVINQTTKKNDSKLKTSRKLEVLKTVHANNGETNGKPIKEDENVQESKKTINI